MEPIGIRQNNPGNIRYGAGFVGEEEGERGFGRYASPEAGGRALLKNLDAYHRKHGLNTVAGIIGRWAPPNENDTGAYVNAVAAHLGVAPDTPLDMQDPGTLAKLGTAISKQEGNGRVFNAQFFETLVEGGTPRTGTTLAQVYAETQNLPPFIRQQARTAAFMTDGNLPDISDTSHIDQIWTTDNAYHQAAALHSADQVAAGLNWAGVGESAWDGVQQNVTCRIYDWFQRGTVDPNFDIKDEQFNAMGKAGILPHDNLTNYVKDARNQEDFERRLDIAAERRDLFERMGNTRGLQAWGNTAASFVGGMADPVAIVASMGAGAAVASARMAGAVARARSAAAPAGVSADVAENLTKVAAASDVAMNAARASRAGSAALSGAAENIVAGEFIRYADNQDFSWGDMAFQGMFGAGLGALGGVMAVRAARREAGRLDMVADAMIDNAARNVETSLQSGLEHAYVFGMSGGKREAGWLSTDIADFPVEKVLPTFDSIDTTARLNTPRPRMPGERVGTQQAGESRVGARRVPQVRRLHTGGEGNQIARFSKGKTGDTGFAEIQHARYQEFKKNGLIEEVRAEELEGLPADAKAVYVPEDGAVYVIRDRLTPEEVKDPTGLIAHEIGVHYGLERTLGSEKYAQVLREVERLSKTDARVREALEAVPKDTPASLVLEEALGYFAEKNPTLGTLARIMADIRAWLREHIPLFKNMGLTADELTRLVQGSVEAARNPVIRASEGLPRYSKTQAGQGMSEADRIKLRTDERTAAIIKAARDFDETVDPAGRAQQERLRKFYDEVRAKAGADKVQPWLDSPGLITARSKSKVTRYLGGMLFESASGMGKRRSTVAIEYERMQLGYKWMAIPTLKESLIQGLSAKERALYYVGGAKEAEMRVWREVEVERQKRRQAVQTGVRHESTAPEHIKKAADVMDAFYEKVVEDGLLAKNPLAGFVKGGGTVGHIPYQWNSEKISKLYREDPTRFKAFYDNLVQQYIEKFVDPAVTALPDKGPVTPDEIMTLREALTKKVAHVVDNKISTIMADPHSRVDGADLQFEVIAGDLMRENFAGQQITPEVIQQFKEQLAHKRQDRRRTELDLLREVNGAALLDFLDYNAISQVTHNAHRWAGLNALARRGFTDIADVAAAKKAMRHDKATQAEMDAVDFGFRAYGLGQLRNHERAAFGTLRNFTFAATMGKLGLPVLADAANVISAVGVRGMMSVIGRGFAKNTALLEQLAIDAPGLLGQDYRLTSLTPDVSATGRMMVGEGSTINRVSQRAAQAVSYLSGANHIQKLLHKAFLPVFAEDVLGTINGKNGGMSLARMVDLGIDRDVMARIKTQLDRYDAGRERGGRLNWDMWDDQQAADELKNAFHRGTYQVFQRAMVGEQPMWMTDSTIGSLVGQFRRFGMIAAEKQAARNLAIGDENTTLSFVLGATWATMLYYARLEANTAGMSAEDKEKHIERNTTGLRMSIGIMNLWNASGILPEGAQLAEIVFGGASFNQTGAPIASLRWMQNLQGTGNQLGAFLTGQSEDSTQSVRSLFRIAPGGNTFMGSWLMNEMTSD